MAQFRGTLSGARGDASRLGNKVSGLLVEAASWQGKVSTLLYHDSTNGTDMAHVMLTTHNGAGTVRTLYHGPVRGDPQTDK